MDSFAEIAARRTSERSHLKPHVPWEKPRNVLPLGEAGLELPWISPKSINTQDVLEKELERERVAHAPFLRSLSPRAPFQRNMLSLHDWKWRMEADADRQDFASLLAGKGDWEDVTIPHYGGPVGRAVAFYRTVVEVPQSPDATDWTLHFEAADYIARVYCNGRCLGQHEGFFAPFEFAISAFLIPGAMNTIVVELQNDAICGGVKLGDGTKVEGDKLYAATGLGWDDPQRGWHHCPPGMGIFGRVHLEARGQSWVSHVWVRTLDLEGGIEVFLEISGREFVNPPVSVECAIYGENFEEVIQVPTVVPLPHPVGRGANLFRWTTKIGSPRFWDPKSPWLYTLHVTLRDEDRVILDAQSRVFGVRTFQCDTGCEPKGRFLLNGKELRLMGANTMGFEQQDVMRGDMDQLRDDILLAKMCHMNFLRLTQRPVQDAVYEMCDRLGLMTQSDLPLFGMLRRTQFSEAVRQAGEMERMLCPHACNIVVSYINEPFPADWNVAHSRHLTREELERFFTAADQMVLSINPDRVIKPVDGDYDPPAPGLPDNHIYTLWYVGHGLDAGALHAGHWLPTQPGWNHACGEFGAEGLDFADLMRRRYPPEWLPQGDDESSWDPAHIIEAQTGSHYCFFYDRPKTLEEWVKASQTHQAFATRWITEAFRRDSRMVSFAIHLFIDAWPSGWMKSIMDCERRAKLAWFVYRDALSPVHISWRTDRLTCFAGETVPVELWVVNDSGASLTGARIRYQILDGNLVLFAGESPLPEIDNARVCGVGSVFFQAPEVGGRTEFTFRSCVMDSGDFVLHESLTCLQVYPNTVANAGAVQVLSGCGPDWLPSELLQRDVCAEESLPGETVVCSDSDALRALWPDLLERVHRGLRVIVFDLRPGTWKLGNSSQVVTEPCGMGPRHFVSRATGHPVVDSFQAQDFRFWYDGKCDRISPLLNHLIVGSGGRSVLASGQLGWGQPLASADAVREYQHGKGSLVFCCLELKDHLSNPAAIKFLERLILPCGAERDISEEPELERTVAGGGRPVPEQKS